MDRGAWWAAVHGVMKSRTRLSDFTFTFSEIAVTFLFNSISQIAYVGVLWFFFFSSRCSLCEEKLLFLSKV